jgi:hypothetical protein
MKPKAFLLLLAVAQAATSVPAGAGGISDLDTRLRTDADIITAVDDSSSIIQTERLLAYTGLARAVRDPRFLARIASGTNGRVGFMAFSWSANGKTDVVVPWMVIATAGDAEIAADLLLTGVHIGPSKQFSTRATDLALAIGTAAMIEHASPYAAAHTFINICSDGISNTGAPPRAVRDRAVGADVTISAVLFGKRPMLADYYARNVVGGPGAFIMPVSDTAAMSILLVRKYWLDLTS